MKIILPGGLAMLLLLGTPCFQTRSEQVLALDKRKAEVRQMRVLVFPKKFSFGKLFTYNDKDPAHLASAKDVVADELGTAIGNARGSVALSLPPHAPIYLSASYELIKHPQALLEVKPDVVDALSFGNFGVVEDLGKIYEPLAHLTGLRLLDLDVSEVNDENMLYLKTLVNLENLSLTMCQVRGKCFKSLPFPRLNKLELSGNTLDNEAYAAIARYKTLEWLSVGHTGADDAALIELTKLKQLRHLGLTQCKVSARGLALIKTMPRLQELELMGTRLTLHDLISLKGMSSSLKVLTLPSGKFSRQDRHLLQLALPKTQLNLPQQVDGETNELFAPLH